MRTLDQGHRWSRVPGQDALAEECRCCAVVQLVADPETRGTAPYVAEDVDDDAVTVSGPELDGVVVIPRQHISGLEDLSDLGRAHLLAALRRATLSVQERNPDSATSIVVTTEPPGAEGHVCFHVVVTDTEDPVSPTPGRE